jgi:hypothetical protein
MDEIGGKDAAVTAGKMPALQKTLASSLSMPYISDVVSNLPGEIQRIGGCFFTQRITCPS